jgi:hypothetical protein
MGILWKGGRWQRALCTCILFDEEESMPFGAFAFAFAFAF